MKIKFTILVLCVPFLMIMLSSCANMSQNNKKGESKMTSNNSTINVPVPSWENKEEKAVAEAWKVLVERILKSDKITKVEYIQGIPLDPQVFSSQNISLIKRWKTLLPKFSCSVIPFELYDGNTATLSFYEGEISLSLFSGHPAPDILIIKEGKTNVMLHIDNYDKVKDEFSAILKDMGV